MPVVTETINLPGLATGSGVRLTVRLVAATEGEGAGYSPTTTILGSWTPPIDGTGKWSASLDANSTLTPSGTVYELITEAPGRPKVTRYISVPETAGPHEVADLLTEAPASIDATGLQSHLDDTSGAHTAAAVSYSPTGTVGATNVQAAVAEVATDAAAALAAHIAEGGEGGGPVDASDVSFTPGGTIAATNVQNAVAEVATDAAAGDSALDSRLDAIEALGPLATDAEVATLQSAIDTKAPLAGATFTGKTTHGAGVTVTDDDGTTLNNGLRSMVAILPPTIDDEVVGLTFKVPDGSWGIGQDYTEGNFIAFLTDADGPATVSGPPMLRTITGTTNATPVVVTTSAAHDYSTGDNVRINGTGIVALDGGAGALYHKWWKITVLSTTTFSLNESTAPGSTSATGWAMTDRNPVVCRIADTGYGTGGAFHVATGLKGRSGLALGPSAAIHVDLFVDAQGITINNASASRWGPTPISNYITVMDARAANAVRFAVNAGGQTLFDPGTVALPGLAPVGDIDTGMFRISDNVIGFSVGGTERLRITGTGITLNSGLAQQVSVGNAFGIAAILFGSANDTFIGRGAAGVVTFGAGGLNMQERATPANPAADNGILYSKDVGGVTGLYWRRSDGSETRVDA